MSIRELLSDLRYRVRALVRRDAIERELNDELRFHFEREVEKHVRHGVPHGDAVRRARITFGGVERIKDDARDARGVVLIETILQDLRYALRGLRNRPVFTLGVMLTLGLGIGATAVMFGIIDRLLFRPPAYLRDASRVHRVYLMETTDGVEEPIRNLPFARYLDLSRWTRSFSAMAAFSTTMLAVGDGEDARERPVSVVTASYFDFFEARPVVGRFFGAEEDSVPAGVPVVVLGYSFWQSQYGGRADVLGRQIQIGETRCTIIGVAPQGFVGMTDQGVPAAFMPITAFAFARHGPSYPKLYTWSWLEIVARRAPAATLPAAESDLSAAYRRSWIAESVVIPDLPTIEAGRPHAVLAPLSMGRGPQAGRDTRIMTWIGGMALIVLLVACANVAGLLLSRAVSRRREIALRVALGVSRARLVRQLLTESLVLAVLGGVAGLIVAQWGGQALRAFYLGKEAVAVVTDPRTLAFAALATLGAALLTGLVPAAQSGGGDLAATLKAGARDGKFHRSHARTLLLVFQAALSVVLLIGAGLFIRSLQQVRAYRLGYDVESVLFADGKLRGVELNSAEMNALSARLLDAARAMPGVTHAALTISVPFRRNDQRPVFVDGIDSTRKLGKFILQAASADYFATVGTRILRGRGFDGRESERSQQVAVVSEGMARVLWPGREAIGQCLRIERDTKPCTTVVGIAEEMHLREFANEREFSYYIPIAQYGTADPSVFVRVNGDAGDYAEVLRRHLQRVMPGSAYVTVTPMQQLVAPNLRAWRLGATMFVAFGGLALALAAIGLYSVIAYNVAQRTQELGVRIALGASVGNVVRIVVAGGMRLVVAGVIIGGVIAFLAARWVETLLFRESPRDPLVFGVVASVLLGVALLASLVPALRAARVDPNVALRAD